MLTGRGIWWNGLMDFNWNYLWRCLWYWIIWIIFRDFFRLGGQKSSMLSQDALHRSLLIWRSKVFIHTRNRLKYNGRLFLWAGIMFAGNFALNHLLNADSLTVYNNIFFTLAMGVLALNVWCYPVKSEKISPKAILALRILLAVPITVYACIAYEGSQAVVPFMLICYFLRNKVKFAILLFVCYLYYCSFQRSSSILRWRWP